jgi:hypothetical protein
LGSILTNEIGDSPPSKELMALYIIVSGWCYLFPRLEDIHPGKPQPRHSAAPFYSRPLFTLFGNIFHEAMRALALDNRKVLK